MNKGGNGVPGGIRSPDLLVRRQRTSYLRLTCPQPPQGRKVVEFRSNPVLLARLDAPAFNGICIIWVGHVPYLTLQGSGRRVDCARQGVDLT